MELIVMNLNSRHVRPMLESSLNHKEYRSLCLRCLRAEATCLCEGIRPFSTFAQIVLLQHPKERKNAIGTARFTHLSITGSRLIAGTDFDNHPDVISILENTAYDCYVLFPGPGSTNLATHRDEFVSNLKRKLVIFVIDGTWSHAKGMLRKSTRLQSLPRVSFTLEKPSNYRVRKQPREFCLSTVEAVARLLRLLDPEAPSENLIETFNEMVERQIKYAKRGKLREDSGENA